jgi:hypothetical protein
MMLEDALDVDTIALRPYYSDPRLMGDPGKGKYIATRNGRDFMLVWADSMRQVESNGWTMGDLWEKARGKADWFPLRLALPRFVVRFRWRSSEDL